MPLSLVQLLAPQTPLGVLVLLSLLEPFLDSVFLPKRLFGFEAKQLLVNDPLRHPPRLFHEFF